MSNNKIAELEQELKNFVVHEPEVFSRIVGYFRPVQAWNSGKAAEFIERKTFDSAVK